VALAAAAGAAAPAHAADTHLPAERPAGACGDARGITVVVEPGSLGGDPEISCVAEEPGDTATDLLERAGHRLSWVRSSPDFVCRVDGRPADAGCAQPPPADAYWSLWWSKLDGSWTYASLGVNELTVPSGGAVAFTWVDGKGDGTPVTSLSGKAAGASASATASPSTHVTAGAPSASDGDAPDDGADLPGWVPPVVILALLGAVAALLARRRRGSRP